MRLPRLSLAAPIVVALLAAMPASAQTRACPAPEDSSRTADAAVRYLADPRMQGRGPGTAGERCAREYVAARFARLGLRPAGEGGGYYQEVVGWRRATIPAANVIGILPGTDPTARAVVIGAHHDHLGRDEGGTIFPGADDNASGVAGLLRVAELLAADPPARPVVFVTFTWEEAGLHGSKRYVERPAHPLAATAAMINLDMIGRLRTQPLEASGLSTGPLWAGLLREANSEGVRLRTIDRVEKGSDHLPFDEAGIPTLYLKTGEHRDYHQPTDTWRRVDADGVEAVARLVARLVRAMPS